jgi:hypothetical protein
MFGARKKGRGPSPMTLDCVREAMPIKQNSEKRDGPLISVPEVPAGRLRMTEIYCAPTKKQKSGRTLPAKREAGHRMRSGRRRTFFALLLDVAVLDLLHEGFALEELGLEMLGERAGDDEELIVDHLGDRDESADGNQVRAPLNMRPVFQRMKTARTMDTMARAALRDPKIRAKRSRKTPRPRMTSIASGTKKRLLARRFHQIHCAERVDFEIEQGYREPCRSAGARTGQLERRVRKSPR